MTTFVRWLLVAVVLAGGWLVAAPDAAAAPAAPAAQVLDGVQLRYLPAGLGSSTDFAYEYDEVAFAARVWESGSDVRGWRVDLHVGVMRSDRLANGRSLHDWFIAYQERPAAEARYVPVRVHGRPGWLCRDEVFWLVRPGLALSVQLDSTRWPQRELLQVARAARTLPE
jgi:hypothetical protein